MSVKRKNQHTLPNRQLARIFNFSAQDLAANRAGFMSWAQVWGIPLWVRRLSSRLGSIMTWRTTRRPKVLHVCGKASLNYVQQEIHAPFHSDIRELHFLFVDDTRFLLTPYQYRAIGEGIPYHIYYVPQSKRILSIERAIPGCDSSATGRL